MPFLRVDWQICPAKAASRWSALVFGCYFFSWPAACVRLSSSSSPLLTLSDTGTLYNLFFSYFKDSVSKEADVLIQNYKILDEHYNDKQKAINDVKKTLDDLSLDLQIFTIAMKSVSDKIVQETENMEEVPQLQSEEL